MVTGEKDAWTTMEELLLSCAVQRHGTDSWDSIAMEVQNRSSRPNLRAFFSSEHCNQKYGELIRRFTEYLQLGEENVKTEGDNQVLSFIVDELKRLRIAELKCELQRGDELIESLQLKLKKLEEEEEKELDSKQEDARRSDRKPTKQEIILSGEETSRHDNGFFIGSNSTQEVYKPDLKNDLDGLVLSSVYPNQLDDSMAHLHSVYPDELNNLVADLEGVVKESTKPMTKEKADGVEASVEADGVAIREDSTEKSQSLMRFLTYLRSHEYGSLFQHRLQTQETQSYRKIIRQHMDLHIVQSRLDQGIYFDTTHKFFRDLLLLFNNVIVFFQMNSPEYIAALELRELVMGEIAKTIPGQQPDSVHVDETPHQSPHMIVSELCHFNSIKEGKPEVGREESKDLFSNALLPRRSLRKRNKIIDLKNVYYNDDYEDYDDYDLERNLDNKESRDKKRRRRKSPCDERRDGYKLKIGEVEEKKKRKDKRVCSMQKDSKRERESRRRGARERASSRGWMKGDKEGGSSISWRRRDRVLWSSGGGRRGERKLQSSGGGRGDRERHSSGGGKRDKERHSSSKERRREIELRSSEENRKRKREQQSSDSGWRGRTRKRPVVTSPSPEPQKIIRRKKKEKEGSDDLEVGVGRASRRSRRAHPKR